MTDQLFGERYSSATFSECRRYRYTLSRRWCLDKKKVAFIGLNPSTADEFKDDATVRRCANYALDWGFGSLQMLNIFAFRATEPAEMKSEPEPVGPENDSYLVKVVQTVDLIVCGWGANGSHRGRNEEVLRLLSGFDLHCLTVTKDGHPGHPLYLKKELRPVLFQERRRVE